MNEIILILALINYLKVNKDRLLYIDFFYNISKSTIYIFSDLVLSIVI